MAYLNSSFANLCIAAVMTVAANPAAIAGPAINSNMQADASPDRQITRIAKRNVPPLNSRVRICRRGYGQHYDPFGNQTYGAWRECRLVARRCATGHGWHFSPTGQQIFGNFWTCRVAVPPDWRPRPFL